MTGQVGWRQDGIKYKKNEVFLDAIETVNMLVSAQGSVLRCDVQGRVVVKCFLSGMPDVKLGLNDKLEDVAFHPCVNLGRFQAEQVVSFVPPDGEFELMRYRCTEGISLPFKAVVLVTEKGRTRLEVSLKMKSLFPANLAANNVLVLVPMPEQTARASFQISAGRHQGGGGGGGVLPEGLFYRMCCCFELSTLADLIHHLPPSTHTTQSQARPSTTPSAGRWSGRSKNLPGTRSRASAPASSSSPPHARRNSGAGRPSACPFR